MPPTEETARERQLERYLLGALPDEEMDRLEPRLLVDDELFSKLEATEDDLIDRYVSGELAPGERRSFEERLLPSARVRERISLTRALHGLAGRIGTGREEHDGKVVPMAPFHATRPAPPRTTPTWLAWAACLVLLLATGYLGILNNDLKSQLETARTEHQTTVERMLSAEKEAAAHADALGEARSQARDEGNLLSELEAQLTLRDGRIAALEREIAAADHGGQELRSDDSASTVLFLALATRAHQEPAVLSLPLKGTVELQLDLDRLQPRGTLTAVVERNGVSIWREENLAPELFGAEAMLPLQLPKQIFIVGSYTIKIIAGDGRGAEIIGSYELTAQDD